MRFEVDIAAFTTTGRDAIALLDVLLQGVDGRHTVVVDPPLRTSAAARTTFRAWLSTLLREDGVIAESLREHFERRATRSDRVQLRTTVRVEARSDSAWHLTLPRVTPQDASRLARAPLAIILEDAVNDGAFLLALSEVAGESGPRVREHLARGWMRLAHGGGITSIPRLLHALEEAHVEVRRCAVVVDHDGDKPDAPSPPSRQVEEVCAELGVPFVRLRRRAIENYAPIEALEQWALGALHVRKDVRNPARWKQILHEPGDRGRAARAEVLTRWKAMERATQDHHPMKGMFAEDLAERVFAGFTVGRDRGDGAAPERFVVQPAWLRRNGSADEAAHLLETLLRSA